MPGFFFISSPYTSFRSTKAERTLQQAERYLAVMRFTAHCFKQKLSVFSPILHCHELAKRYELPTDADWWESFNFSFVQSSDGVFVLCMPGWRDSKGVKKEMKWALDWGLPIELVDVEKDGTYTKRKL